MIYRIFPRDFSIGFLAGGGGVFLGQAYVRMKDQCILVEEAVRHKGQGVGSDAMVRTGD